MRVAWSYTLSSRRIAAPLLALALTFALASDARADDLDLLNSGGGTACGGRGPPPNIVFLFDTSGSMNNLVCEDMSGTSDCSTSTLIAHTAPNSAKVCENSVFKALKGPDTNGDGQLDLYRSAYSPTDGTTWVGSLYPIYDERKSGSNDDFYTPWTVYSHGGNSGWTLKYTGTGGSVQAEVDSVITSACGTITDCSTKSRCIYSLRVLGYYWEPSGSSCASGDPLSLCGGSPPPPPPPAGGGTCPSDGSLGTPCSKDSNCDSGLICQNNSCSECQDKNDCNGNSCKSSNCAYSYCSGHTCSIMSCTAPVCPTDKSLGTPCTKDSDCNSGLKCDNQFCSQCKQDNDCGNNHSCKSSGCIYSYCSTSSCTIPYCAPAKGSSTPSGPGQIFLGDFLNFYPPKGVTLIREFVDLITHMSGDVRIGVSDFNDSGGNIKFSVSPPCAQANGEACFDGDPATVCFNSSDANLINYLYNTLAFSGSTPIGKALDNIGAYYTTSTGAAAPICNYGTGNGMASNYVIMVTDGMPNSDGTSASSFPHSNGGVANFRDGFYNANGYFLDDVASALTKIDHRTDIPGLQEVDSYAVSFGLLDATDPSLCDGLLEQTAAAGKGRCIPATSADQLRNALTHVVAEVILRSMGFTAPGVQGTRTTGSVALSDARFRMSSTFSLWEGHLFSFKVCDEKLGRETGSACTCLPAHGATDAICVQDANNQPIAFDSNGYLTSKPLWDAALCLAGNLAGTTYSPPDGPDQNKLDVTACYTSATNRVIKTAVATQASATTTLDNADVITFAAASVTTGSALLTALGVTGNVVADAQKVVNFFRGFDVFDADGDTTTSTQDRNLNEIRDGSNVAVAGWWKLGDIFHSIPNTVAPPSAADLGVWGTSASYKAFITANATRPTAILVGANDGMLHAFRGSDGKELWAFMSPEMLPKLKDSAHSGGMPGSSHPFMLDGSVTIRNIWTGPSTATAKDTAGNSTYWKTVAVVGHRDGGSTYLAFDVTDVANPPILLWQFPQPSMTTEATEMGKSWLDTYPAPASIGPMSVTVSGGTTDKWVVLLSGGFDQLDRKGRMLVILDAYTGAIMWEANSTTATDMKYSFPATPVFYTDSGTAQPYIAGIVAADHGGQIWHIPTPGQALSSGRFTFTPSVVFTAGPPALTPIAVNTDLTLTATEYQRWPFFFAPTLTRANGKIRVIIGTGDRDWLVPNAGAPAAVKGNTGYTCTDRQRLYSVGIERCGSGPCDESNLTEIIVNESGVGSTYAATDALGWFYQLSPGEKSAAPYNILHGYAMYSTFLPTTACGASVTCDSGSKGEARMYTRHFVSGKPLDWNDNGSLVGETYVTTGQGVPTAPSVSVGVSAAGATPTIFAGGSDSGLLSRSAGSLSSEMAQEIMRFEVSREVHDALH